MATMSKSQRTKPTPGSQRVVLLCIVIIAFLLLLSSVSSTGKLGLPYQQTLIDYFVRSPRGKREHSLSEKYLYWGNRIDCPGKNCETCAGLGHQESSLRCALEEAMFLNRTFVMPSGMCINPIHNKKGILNRSDNKTTEEGYKLAYSSNFSEILDPIIKNNYQLFMVERLVMMGAKTFFKTFKEYETDLTLTDDPKKNKNWEIPVYTMNERKEAAS